MTLDLIAKLESASEGSRALSEEVAVALGWKRAALLAGWKAPNDPFGRVQNAPGFTESIDAAISAIPDGWLRTSGNADLPAVGRFRCRLKNENPDYEILTVYAATEPLAIVAAALRARMGETR